MNRIKKMCLISVSAIFLAACGDDSSSTSGPSDNGVSSSVISDDDSRSSNSVSSSSTVAESSSNADTTMTDPRDNQVYRIVNIGDFTWMAENLNYKVDSSYCYNDSAEKCEKYGRLYTWYAAVGMSKEECGVEHDYECVSEEEVVQGICPDGWHLPADWEWKVLFDLVGGQGVAGVALKSTSDWQKDGNGTDAYGFNVLPAGLKNGGGDYISEGRSALFWSGIMEGPGISAYRVTFEDKYDNPILERTSYSGANYVRCVKNELP